jgi:MinD-like ATPase involved in chromosome partitioning or flagellar assembly
MVMDRRELTDAARIIVDASRKLGVAMDFLGFLPFDPVVRQSVRRMVPFAAYAHRSKISRELMKIVVEKFLPLRAGVPRDARALSREAGRVLKSCGAKLAENRGASPVTPGLEIWSPKAG